MRNSQTVVQDTFNPPGDVPAIDSGAHLGVTTPKSCDPPENSTRNRIAALPLIRSKRWQGRELLVMRPILLAATVAMLVLAIGGVAQAQGEPTVDETAAMFEGTTIDNWTGAGFMMTPDCVTAVSAGAPAELGVMGFHAINPARFDFDVVAAEPEVLLVDGDGNVVGFEYEVPDQSQSRPSLFGVDFDDTPPHSGFDVPHWSLHVWTIDNPLGQFSPWNPTLSCPATTATQSTAETALAVTGAETPLIAIIGLTLGTAGLIATWERRRLLSQS